MDSKAQNPFEHRARCPVCGGNGFRSYFGSTSHMERETCVRCDGAGGVSSSDPTAFTDAELDDAIAKRQAAFVAAQTDVERLLAEHHRRRGEHPPITTLVLLQYVDDPKLRIVVRGLRFADKDPNFDQARHDEYFYNEHTCPAGYLSNVVAIAHDGDDDPHGVFDYVRTEVPDPSVFEDTDALDAAAKAMLAAK